MSPTREMPVDLGRAKRLGSNPFGKNRRTKSKVLWLFACTRRPEWSICEDDSREGLQQEHKNKKTFQQRDKERTASQRGNVQADTTR